MRYIPNNKKNEYPYANDYGLDTSYVRQPSLVDAFYITENKCPETGETTHQFAHPLYMLFNQERIDRLGDTTIRQWLKSLEATNSKLAELRTKVSDDDLLSMVKSRHIQHPCELARYMQSLDERADFFNSEVARIVAEEKQAQGNTEPVNIEPPKSE